MKFSHIVIFLLSILATFSGRAQVVEEMPEPPFIKTVQFRGNTEFGQLPILRLGERLSLTFDDIIGDEADYFYTIRHYDADWTPSQLARAEYMDGMDNVRILTYENSVAALQLYTNYQLTIPNRNTRRLKKTGNYLLSIYNEDQELIFSRKFMIYNPQVTVGAEIKRSRDLNYINSKQVVRFFIDGGDNPLINPKQTVKTVIFQNNNLKNAITGVKPQYTIGSKLEYRYDQETAFWAGNEFHGFENKDIRAATAQIRRIDVKKLYHNYLYTNLPRYDRPYTYNPDINGNFVVTTLQGQNANTDAEYVWIHFSLAQSELEKGKELHVYGNFNNYTIDKSTKMKYDERAQEYYLPMLLKQGFYNYKYVLTDSNGNIDYSNAIDGNFWQTENEYQILVYYRRPGGRFDELIGIGNTNSSTITN